MNLNPTIDELEIAEAIGRMLQAEAPFENWFVPQVDMLAEERRLVAFGAEMGWVGLAFPEDQGGSGAGLVEEVLMFRELGARLAPVAISAAAIGARVAIEHSRADWAENIVAGAARVAVSAFPQSHILLGAAEAQFVLSAGRDRLILSKLTEAPVAELGWDGATSIATGALSNSGGVEASRATFNRFRLLIAAQLQGLARTAVEQSNAYAKERTQFGKPIGSFQAVRHRIADMEMAARRAEAALSYATVCLENGHADAEFQILSALVLAQDAALLNAQTNIANHGAIGVTEENVGHLLLKRALLLRSISGATEALLDELAVQEAPVI